MHVFMPFIMLEFNRTKRCVVVSGEVAGAQVIIGGGGASKAESRVF